MIRNILSVLAGLAAGMAVNMGFVIANGILFPAPEEFDWQDAAMASEYFATLPALAFALVLTAHLGQAFVGGWVAAKISETNPMSVALTVGALTLVAGVINMMNMPLPGWMWIEMPLYLLVAWLAGKIEVARRQAI